MCAATACLGVREKEAFRPFGDTSIGCASREQTAYHIHTHLALLIEGQQMPVPANLGIVKDCIAFVHTHNESGIIHVEAPAEQRYLLGDLFAVWGQPLSAERLLDRVTTGDQQVIAYVDGERFSGPPESIPFEDKRAIVLMFGPPFATPPPYTFPKGF